MAEKLFKDKDFGFIFLPYINPGFELTLAMMKKDAVLINTARGSIIDEKALYEHMKAGNLKNYLAAVSALRSL